MVRPALLQEQVGITLARESSRDPRIRVNEIPNGNANAPLDIGARFDGVIVVKNLLRLSRCSWRQVEADVEFGDRNVHVKRCECLLVRDLIL